MCPTRSLTQTTLRSKFKIPSENASAGELAAPHVTVTGEETDLARVVVEGAEECQPSDASGVNPSDHSEGMDVKAPGTDVEDDQSQPIDITAGRGDVAVTENLSAKDACPHAGDQQTTPLDMSADGPSVAVSETQGTEHLSAKDVDMTEVGGSVAVSETRDTENLSMKDAGAESEVQKPTPIDMSAGGGHVAVSETQDAVNLCAKNCSEPKDAKHSVDGGDNNNEDQTKKANHEVTCAEDSPADARVEQPSKKIRLDTQPENPTEAAREALKPVQ